MDCLVAWCTRKKQVVGVVQSTLTDQSSGVVLDERDAVSDTVRRRLRETSTVHQQGSLASKLRTPDVTQKSLRGSGGLRFSTSLLTGTYLSSPPLSSSHTHTWQVAPRPTRFLQAAASERAR